MNKRDLLRKRQIRFSPPDISELEIQEVVEVLRSGWITTGPRTKLLERRLAAYIETGKTDIDCNTEENTAKYSNRVVCLNSATAAEELNLRILGVGPGYEVIVPAYTYTASASAAIHCGAKVVFVDIKPNGDNETHLPEMDYDKLKDAITPRTKAVIAVDLSGIVCNYEKLFEVVKSAKHLFTPKKSDGTPLGDLSSRIQNAIGRVAVVADCAHSLGASRMIYGKRQYCGAIGDFSSFSFHAVKNLTTGEGGAATWRPIDGIDNSTVYKMYQLLSLHGQNKDALSKTRTSCWEYDIIGPWYKCNMTDIMAALGLVQMERYEGLLKRRQEIVAKYNEALKDLPVAVLNHKDADHCSSHHLYLVRLLGKTREDANKVIEQMAERGIACNVHYKPLPMMTAYKALGFDIKDYPNAYHLFENEVTLPLHTKLTDEDVEYVISNFVEIVKSL